MKKRRFLVSLITRENDYQLEQASAAVETARRLGADVEVVFAEGDPITQSQQLLKTVQAPTDTHPDAIVLEPAGGTEFPHVARAAVTAGIAWVVINREADYIADLRRVARSPIFCVSADHLEIGRIQGQHIATLAPPDGTVVYIQGPSNSSVVKHRTIGMEITKPAKTRVIILRGQWTEESAYKAVCSWLLLSTSQKLPIDMVVSQNDDMAVGARRAFQERAGEAVKEKWLNLPFTGVDGLPRTGQEYVRRGTLAATVIVSPLTILALETLARAFQTGSQPPEMVLAAPTSFPPLEELARKRLSKAPTITS